MNKNTLGRTILKGPRGGEYVLDSRGKKVYKFKKAAAPAPPKPETPKDVMGRKIFKGPKGGLYVLHPVTGKKVYKVEASESAKRRVTENAPLVVAVEKNTLGRTIHKGPRGGKYVINSTGKKVYKFHTFGPAPVAAGAPAPAAAVVNKNGFSKDKPNIKRQTVNLDVPRIRFDPNTYTRALAPRKITVYTADVDRQNVFALRGSNVDVLKQWIQKQADFIQNLSMDDFMTVAAYTNRSHWWIGPYLIDGKVKTMNLNNVGKTTVVPLFPQIKKLIDETRPKPENVISSAYILNKEINAKNYGILADSKASDADRYKAYVKIARTVRKEFLKPALDMYAKDFQSIILRAPPIEKSVFLYRGSKTAYANLQNPHTVASFSSTSFSPSYSLGYGTGGYHRVELVPGSHALALAIVNRWNASGEYEVVLPMNTVYTPRYDRRVKRWIQKNSTAAVEPYRVSNYVVRTP